MEPQDKILNAALGLFFRYGIRHVTMDDIAKELGMSKKTIYQYYKEKDDLVNQLLEQELNKHEDRFCDLSGNAADAVHEMILISDRMRDMMQHINPMFFLDLQKYYPTGFERFRQFKQVFAMEHVKQNLKRGKLEKLYREDLDIEFAAGYRMVQLDILMFGNHFSFDRSNLAKVSDELLHMFMYGISNLKGHKLINHYKKINEAE